MGRRSASHSGAELAPARAPASRLPVCAVGLVGRQDHAFSPPGAGCPVLSWGQAGIGALLVPGCMEEGGSGMCPFSPWGATVGSWQQEETNEASGFIRASSAEEVRHFGRFGEWASVTLRKGE